MMTKGEFIDAIAELLEDYGYAYMNRQEARSVSIDSWARDAQERMDTAEDGLLAVYDAMAERIAELEAERDAARAEAQARLESHNAEVDEFSAGFDAYRAGLSFYDQPEVIYDVWRVGYAWAAYDAQVERIAELEAMLKRIEWGERTLDGRVIFCGCPVCLAAPYTHAPDCELAALLRSER